jgi:hypothetical protein
VNRTVELISPVWWLRQLAAFAMIAAALLIWSSDVDARLKGQSNFIRSALPSYVASPSYNAPPMVPKYVVVAALDHPSPGTQSGTLGGLFNRPGLVAGCASGLLGAGFLGPFFGHGVFGGLNGIAAGLGLAFQLLLVATLGRLIWKWWTGRNQPAFTGLSPRELADPYLRTRHELLPAGALSKDDEETEAGSDLPEQHRQSAAAGER